MASLSAPDPFERIQALQQLVGILIARLGGNQAEIGDNELRAIPADVMLVTWRSPSAFTHIVRTDLSPQVIDLIRRFGEDMAKWDAAHSPADDIVDAEIVEDRELTAGQRALET